MNLMPKLQLIGYMSFEVCDDALVSTRRNPSHLPESAERIAYLFLREFRQGAAKDKRAGR
jgi:hypothetical protein